MTRFPPCPSCTELPADLGRLPASVCKPFAAGMYKQAVKIGFGPETYKTDHAVKQRTPSPLQPGGGGRIVTEVDVVVVVGADCWLVLTSRGKPTGSEFGSWRQAVDLRR